MSWKRRGCLWVSGQQKTLTKAHPTPNRSLVLLYVCCYAKCDPHARIFRNKQQLSMLRRHKE